MTKPDTVTPQGKDKFVTSVGDNPAETGDDIIEAKNSEPEVEVKDTIDITDDIVSPAPKPPAPKPQAPRPQSPRPQATRPTVAPQGKAHRRSQKAPLSRAEIEMQAGRRALARRNGQQVR